MLANRCDVAAVAIEFVEFADAFTFAREELDNRHAAERLGQVRVEGREPFTDLRDRRCATLRGSS